jgi:hypothetical protein
MTKRAMEIKMREAGKEEGDGKGIKSDGNGKEEGDGEEDGGWFSSFNFLIPTSPMYITRGYLYLCRKTMLNDLACHIGPH